jgi:hypothetical protein
MATDRPFNWTMVSAIIGIILMLGGVVTTSVMTKAEAGQAKEVAIEAKKNAETFRTEIKAEMKDCINELKSDVKEQGRKIDKISRILMKQYGSDEEH